MIKLLIKIVLTELILSGLPAGIIGAYFDSHPREAHPIIDAIETFATIILFQSLVCIGGLFLLGMLYMVWTL